ncbi:hypothetical protein TWF730_000388 [Orbilia blumenaviensis]|uniref:Uncharacterized protein n=1 Tax=Orbilia blumenaviensis TaxID=1796055 RepID=A0AAV9VLQ9_9PEZI
MMRLLHVAALALGLASSCSFAHEALYKDSPDRKRNQSIDDYYATSWTETVTRGASVVVIVHPHAQKHPHYEDGVAEASTGPPQACPASTVPTNSAGCGSGSSGSSSSAATTVAAPAGLASSSPAPTLQPNAKSPSPTPPPLPPPPDAAPPPQVTVMTISSPLGGPAELSPIETFQSTPYYPEGYPKGPLDSSQNQKCTGGTYKLCVASYNCRKLPYDSLDECHCRNNVRESCWYACGGHMAPEQELCPLVPPAGGRPPGLPGPGEGPPVLRRAGQGHYDFSLLRRVRIRDRDPNSRNSGLRKEGGRVKWWWLLLNLWGVWQIMGLW